MIEEKENETIVSASWDMVDEDEPGEVYHEPGIQGLDLPLAICQACNKVIAMQEAERQPNLYRVITSVGNNYVMVYGARYVVADGRLIICAKIDEVGKESEYHEIATFAVGLWVSIAIAAYIKP